MVGRLDDAEIDGRLGALTGWTREGDEIRKEFVRAGLRRTAIAFVVRVGFLAEAADHHPDIDIRWRTVHLALSTHDAGGLTALDFDLATKIDEAAGVIFVGRPRARRRSRHRARRRRREEPRSVADGDRARLRARLGRPRLRRRLPAVRSRAARRAHQGRLRRRQAGGVLRTEPRSGTSSRRRSPRRSTRRGDCRGCDDPPDACATAPSSTTRCVSSGAPGAWEVVAYELRPLPPPEPSVPIPGLLLTGGASRAWGRRRPTLDVDGETLADRVAPGCSARSATRCVEVGPGYTALPGVDEDPPGRGPARRARRRAPTRCPASGPVVLLACDLPFVSEALLARLAAWPGADTVVPVDRDGFVQPVCARYSAPRSTARPASSSRRGSGRCGRC